MATTASSNALLPTQILQDTLHETREGQGSDETQLLLKAFERFTEASTSLECAFKELQGRARRLSQELEAKNAELGKSLAEKEKVQNYLENILESLPCGVLVLDDTGRVTVCNPVAAQILELPKTKLISADNAEEVVESSGIYEFFTSSIQQNDRRTEVEIPFHDGSEPRVLATSRTYLRESTGKKFGTLHIIRDVTEMKALETQSKRIERLSAMGEMAVELAHEIRNPLGSIELFASLLEKKLPPDSDLGRWAGNIHIGSRSLDNIVSNMLHFANPLTPTFSEVNMHVVIAEVLDFADPILQQREVRIEKQLEATSSTVYGDRELLKQMILNLVLNSMQAMPARGWLKIITRDVDRLPGGALCEAVEVRIEDSGLGIPPENLSRIFDPFFTTNKNGTGLGLSVVHQIVERHSGIIQVESEPDVGTVFFVVLPNSRIVIGAA